MLNVGKTVGSSDLASLGQFPLWMAGEWNDDEMNERETEMGSMLVLHGCELVQLWSVVVEISLALKGGEMVREM